LKIVSKIFVFFATLVIVAHSFVPHQHKVRFEIALHECFLTESKNNHSTHHIFEKLEDIIKHINLGEKNLDEFKLSITNYEFSQNLIYIISEFLSNINFQLWNLVKKDSNYYYIFSKISSENYLGSGLRAPPL
jgi:hypothetical protein